LVLRTSFQLRDSDRRSFQHHEQRRDASGTPLGTLPKYLLHDELALAQVYRYGDDYTVDSVQSNQTIVTAQSDDLLDAAEQQYAATQPRMLRYARIEAIELNGLISQVAWSISTRGATTCAVSGVDVSFAHSSYATR
jgi:hypothetical protein